jgi:hypothetical protein
MADDDPPEPDRLAELPRSQALRPTVGGAAGPCASCGSPQAKVWSTPDGPARLCPPCATLNGIGCP